MILSASFCITKLTTANFYLNRGRFAVSYELYAPLFCPQNSPPRINNHIYF